MTVCLKDLFELTRLWNDVSSVFTLICCAYALVSCDLTPRWTASYSSLQDFEYMSDVFKWCSTISFTVAVLTGMDIISILKMRSLAALEDMNGFVDSVLMCATYIMIGSSYFLMSVWDSLPLVHICKLAHGEPRPIFALRYIQWAVCVPLLMCVGGRQQKHANLAEAVDGLVENPERLQLVAVQEKLHHGLGTVLHPPLLASIRLTVIYIGSSWLAVTLEDTLMHWVLICVSFSDYLIASLQAIVLLLMQREDGHGFKRD